MPYKEDIGGLENLATNVDETQANDIDAKGLEEQQKLYINAKTDRVLENTKNRKCFAYWTFVIISLWLIATVWLLEKNFLPQGVYIALLTTTTLNVIGLPAIVLRGFFSNDD